MCKMSPMSFYQLEGESHRSVVIKTARFPAKHYISGPCTISLDTNSAGSAAPLSCVQGCFPGLEFPQLLSDLVCSFGGNAGVKGQKEETVKRSWCSDVCWQRSLNHLKITFWLTTCVGLHALPSVPHVAAPVSSRRSLS